MKKQKFNLENLLDVIRATKEYIEFNYKKDNIFPEGTVVILPKVLLSAPNSLVEYYKEKYCPKHIKKPESSLMSMHQ